MLHGIIFIALAVTIFFKSGLVPFLVPVVVMNYCWNYGWNETTKGLLKSILKHQQQAPQHIQKPKEKLTIVSVQ
jgi:ABC-type sugar transport system permease subunit